MDLPGRTFPDLEGNAQPFLTPNEVAGPLHPPREASPTRSGEEIEQHVPTPTSSSSQLPWTGEFRRVPEIAYAHHEKLDGTGYPQRKLTRRQDIPVQSRMMTISDIFDASDCLGPALQEVGARGTALDILPEEEAGRGKIDKTCSTSSSRPRSTSHAAAAAAEVAELVGPGGSSPSRRLVPPSLRDETSRHRPPRRLRSPAREHAGLLRERPRGGGRARGARRPAHPGRPRGGDPRRHPGPHHHRRGTGPRAHPGRGPRPFRRLPGALRRRLRRRARPHPGRGPGAPARDGRG